MRRHRRIIFLDIDGVLNTLKFIHIHGTHTLDPQLVSRLRLIVERHGSEIVVSSIWRFSRELKQRLRDRLAETGWNDPPIIGFTPVGSFGNRGEEIQAWLASNPTESFTILDDEDNVLKEQKQFLVQCDKHAGLTDREVEAVNRIWT